MKIGTALKGATTTINLTWLPEFLLITPDALASITALKVTVFGDGVICDLDNAGLDALTGVRDFASLSATLFKIALANGIITGKNVEIVITEAGGVADADVYGFGDNKGDAYVQSLRQTVLANSGAEFTKFGYLGIPAWDAADECNITFVDGLVHKYSVIDGTGRQGMSQNQVTSPGIDNMEGTIDVVSFIPAADRTVYVMRFAEVGNLGNSVFNS